jgi:hypothetical protein
LVAKLTAAAMSRLIHDELAGLGAASQIFDTTSMKRPRVASRHGELPRILVDGDLRTIKREDFKRKERHPSDAAPSFL